MPLALMIRCKISNFTPFEARQHAPPRPILSLAYDFDAFRRVMNIRQSRQPSTSFAAPLATGFYKFRLAMAARSFDADAQEAKWLSGLKRRGAFQYEGRFEAASGPSRTQFAMLTDMLDFAMIAMMIIT